LSKTFSKGVHPRGYKELSANAAITEMPPPKTVYIPVSQHIGAPAAVCVAVGDTVKKGQIIAAGQGVVSTDIFASVSGRVTAIADRPVISGDRIKHVVIENDFAETEFRLPPLENPGADDIIFRIREAGIVGLGGAGFPTQVKLIPPKGKTPEVLIINAAECEPYITCDARIIIEYTDQVLRGARYIAAALGLDRYIIGIEDNKPEAIRALNGYIKENNITYADVSVLKAKYPQGSEKQLIYAATGRVVPSGGLPIACGAVVQNTHTALSVCLAVENGETLYRRVMTVTGNGAAKPLNMWVRTGTLFSEITDIAGFKRRELLERYPELCAELKKLYSDLAAAGKAAKTAKADLKRKIKAKNAEIEAIRGDAVTKAISGGPMMGLALPNLNISTVKTTSCLLLLTDRDINRVPMGPCINCARCAKSCPMNLMPMYIDACSLEDDYAGAKYYGAEECISCGCCSYVCPAKRQLVQSIQAAKKAIKAKGI
jgi:electron transport complex protein RnfC